MKTVTTIVAVVAAAVLAACGAGAGGDGAARRGSAPPSAGTVLAQAKAKAQAGATSTSRPNARVTHHRPATNSRTTPGHPTEIKVSKSAGRRSVRAILGGLRAEPHARPKPVARGESLLARVLKQHPGATPRPVAPTKTGPGQGLLGRLTKDLRKPK